jgi:hypothetical protein
MAGKRLRLPTRQQSPRLFGVRATARRQRRLSDKIRVAFHTACDNGAVEIAERSLNQLDLLIHRPPRLPTKFDRRRPESIVALCERLANLLLWRTQTDLVLSLPRRATQ